jgi:threonine dehydrogenase-like Zn-dependent dehydrogenase
MMALQVYRSPLRYSAARMVAGRAPGLVSTGLAPLRLVHVASPRAPGGDWARVRPSLAGICGSDLALLTGAVSPYFSALVSFPFTPGHEIVGETLDATPELPAGTRVVIDPVLTCAARGLSECAACREGRRQQCSGLTMGRLGPGMQTGFCADAGGGWAGVCLAHRSQLHAVPDTLSDRAAALLEPFACALHAVERGLDGLPHASPQAVMVAGAGPLGLLTILALRVSGWAGHVLAVARHPRQQARALRFGATRAVSPDEAPAAARRLARGVRLEPERGRSFLLDGVDVAFECAGTPSALDLALRTTRAGGRVVLIGLPSAGVDLAPLWFRELELIGAYAATAGFASALKLSPHVASELSELVSAVYPLSHWRQAIDHALDAGRLGAARIAFSPTPTPTPTPTPNLRAN